jgi:hypothetical protein
VSKVRVSVKGKWVSRASGIEGMWLPSMGVEGMGVGVSIMVRTRAWATKAASRSEAVSKAGVVTGGNYIPYRHTVQAWA